MNLFVELPTDLVDLVCRFAYNASLKDTKFSLDWAIQALSWDVPDFLVCSGDYDWTKLRRKPSPLVAFDPTVPPTDWFREDLMCIVLDMLDFRRSEVKQFGNRFQWRKRISADWKHVAGFTILYNAVIQNGSNWKPRFWRLDPPLYLL